MTIPEQLRMMSDALIKHGDMLADECGATLARPVWSKAYELKDIADEIEQEVAEFNANAPLHVSLNKQVGDYCECCDPDVTWCENR